MPTTKRRWADLADTLTATRMLAAVALIPLIWSASISAAAVVLTGAWLTDFFDGRAARMTLEATRLGRWDMRADTAVGAGLVIGLTGLGVIPIWLAGVATIVLGGIFLAGNLAAAMMFQLTGFLPFLHLLATRRPALWWLPFVAAIVVAALDWRRLVYVNIPAFLRGLAGKFEHR